MPLHIAFNSVISVLLIAVCGSAVSGSYAGLDRITLSASNGDGAIIIPIVILYGDISQDSIKTTCDVSKKDNLCATDNENTHPLTHMVNASAELLTTAPNDFTLRIADKTFATKGMNIKPYTVHNIKMTENKDGIHPDHIDSKRIMTLSNFNFGLDSS